MMLLSPEQKLQPCDIMLQDYRNEWATTVIHMSMLNPAMFAQAVTLYQHDVGST